MKKPDIRIVSGGQTGVDRAALDVALELGLRCGGWCPKGRRALDGPIPERYPVKETESADYSVRTRLNVRDADATLILNCGELSGGTAYTLRVAEELGRAVLVQDMDHGGNVAQVHSWLEAHGVRVLNVAGPRENKCPGIYSRVRHFLSQLLAGS
ncbi:MAG TPA: molybdenum cofactor carrier [Thiolapillus brandeum]|uniref:Molybdenum cofactor carrier n=1 Tax=Thiolapillus brandeum TaxID=1076588 RepID=A0A831RVZ5_9GAMM|nr:molybdenum cofactor carrier [Thiolapillus brandeum]